MGQSSNRERCRSCGGALVPVLSLGALAPSDFLAPGACPPPAEPLDLCRCQDCGLVQLRHTVDREALFRQYWYRSGINETMQAELRSIVEQALEVVPVGGADAVLDVGANDGTLLDAYRDLGRSPFRIGIEPANNLQATLRRRTDLAIHEFFPGDGRVVRQFAGQIAILTSIACFYAVEQPREFVAAVAQLLTPRGVWVVQFQDLHQMLQATAFDNICHEHLVYYSLESVEQLIAPYGLQVVYAEQRTINGGSLRLIIRRKAASLPSETVELLRSIETGCEDTGTLQRFAYQVEDTVEAVRDAVRAVRKQGGMVDLYGASTKANTLLQVCGLDHALIRQAWERSAAKWGRTTITGIPIVNEAAGRRDPPDLLLVGIWQFREAVLLRERAYLERGGRILFPLPTVQEVRL